MADEYKSRSENEKWEKKGGFRLPRIENPHLFHNKENGIAWLGHASFFIRIEGVSILTDPCLESLPMFPRLVEKPCSYEEMRNIDYILLSHGHRDHLDLRSLKNIIKYNPQVQILTALNIGTIVQKLNVPVQEAGWWQRFKIRQDQIEIIFLPARHWNRRGILDFNKTLWGSFWIASAKKKLYFAGDTAYWNHFEEIRKVMGVVDIAFMPIGAYLPRYVMKHGHVSPKEALDGFHALEGKTFIPMHYGTYDLGSELLSNPLQKIQAFEKKGVLKGNLQTLPVGEWYKY